MKLCVSLRDPAPKNLQLGNLRSEGRWERNVLDALSKSPLVSELYTAGYVWEGGEQVTPKYRGLISHHAAQQSVLVMHDWNLSTATAFPYKGAVINIFAGPWEDQKAEIGEFVSRMGNKFLFTMSYPFFYNDGSSKQHLEKFVSSENILLLPCPNIIENRFSDRFDNKVLLWSWRIIFMSALSNFEGPHGTVGYPIKWALSKLREDPSLKLYVLTGWDKWEVKDYINEEVLWVKEDINDYFWSMPSFREFSGVRDRVFVKYSIDWTEVLDIYANTKLMINYSKSFGGPPLEAAMYGVPFVGCAKSGVLAYCQDYLYTDTSDEACSLFDKLIVDRTFYAKTALAYNKYAVENYSYDAFCSNLYEILNSRGLGE